MATITELRGLGEKSAEMLAAVGIKNDKDLRQVGPVHAYIAVRDQTDFNPSRNLLYAMIGALEDRDWRTIAQEQKTSLIFALDGYEQLKTLFDEDGF